jgi:hypothetical protein
LLLLLFVATNEALTIAVGPVAIVVAPVAVAAKAAAKHYPDDFFYDVGNRVSFLVRCKNKPP